MPKNKSLVSTQRMTLSQNFLFFILVMFLSLKTEATTVSWNLNSSYGVTQTGFASIITDARNHFIVSPDDTITVLINAGTYTIGGNGNAGINFGAAGLNPGSNGRLIFKGAGMNATTLIFSDLDQDMIRGNDINRLTFSDMHMTRQVYTVTQGIVVSVTAGEVVLDIQNGFPTPLAIYNQTLSFGRYLRKYTNSITNPEVIQVNNDQVAWGWRNGLPVPPVLVSSNRWKFFLNNPATTMINYNVGDLIGVKSKHEGETFFICGGTDILFENIIWTHSSRGLARCGTSNVTIKGCRIERGQPINGQTPCLSSPSGGPQLNQPNDVVSTNMIVDNCFIDSPGDDCVGIFNVDGCKIMNSTLQNSFARAVYIDTSADNTCLLNNTIYNNPVVGNYSSCSIVLAVNYLYFFGETNGISNILKWEILSGRNNLRFEIERSNNGSNWQRIGILNSPNTNTFSFTDAMPNVGNNYYRLKQVDDNNNYEYSTILNLKKSQTPDNVIIYPNPATNTTTVFGITTNKVTLMDIKGTTLDYFTNTQNYFTINMSKYSAGVYLIMADNKIYRIIKIK